MCKHHWLIKTANGETSEGVCKKCGDTRVFSNLFEGRIDNNIMIYPSKEKGPDGWKGAK